MCATIRAGPSSLSVCCQAPAPRAHAGIPPLGPVPFRAGGSRAVVFGGPLCAVFARRGRTLLGGVPPPPSPPQGLLALGVHDHSGEPLSSVSPPLGSRAALACLGFLSPSSFRVMAPWPPSPVAGPALAWPLANASNATLSYSWCKCLLFSVVASSASSKCLVRYPAPPAPAAVSIASSGAFFLPRRVMPRRCCHLSLVPGLLRRWVGFRPLPPAPVRLPPVGSGTL